MKTYKDAMNVVIKARCEIEEIIVDVENGSAIGVEERERQLISLHGCKTLLSVLLDALARNEIE